MLAPPYRHPMTVSRRPPRRGGDTTVDTRCIGSGGEAFDVVGIVDALAAMEAQGKGEYPGDVVAQWPIWPESTLSGHCGSRPWTLQLGV